jgi:hypothetical protein
MDQTSYRYNWEYRASVRALMLELAKQLLSGDLGVVAAARALVPFSDVVEPEIGTILNVFVGIDSETDAFPLGEVRQCWSPESLERYDLRLAAAELLWRETAMDAGAKLVHLLESRLG